MWEKSNVVDRGGFYDGEREGIEERGSDGEGKGCECDHFIRASNVWEKELDEEGKM